MMKFRMKPVTIEAVQVNDITFDEPHPNPEHIPGVVYDPVRRRVAINTPGGVRRGGVGDWLIRDMAGELSLCNAAHFERTYERVNPPANGTYRGRAMPPPGPSNIVVTTANPLPAPGVIE